MFSKHSAPSLDNYRSLSYNNRDAEVAELADALASGVSGLTPVGVQIPPSASLFAINLSQTLGTTDFTNCR